MYAEPGSSFYNKDAFYPCNTLMAVDTGSSLFMPRYEIAIRSILAVAFIWLFAYLFLFLSMPSAGIDEFHDSVEISRKYGLLVATSRNGIKDICLADTCVINIDKIWIERSDIMGLTWYLHIKHTPGGLFQYDVRVDDSRCYGIHKRSFSALEVDILAPRFRQLSMPCNVKGPTYFWASSFLEKRFLLNFHLRDTDHFYRQAVDLD